MELVFVLVEPARPENVGAAARALKTMGFSSLRLVNSCDLRREARWVAHESAELLDQAQHYTSLADALADVDFSIASTARRRLDHDDYLTPGECRQAIAGKGASVARAAIVFGRESSGLTGAELALCDSATSIPIAVPQPSLNLAQAVMLYAWELSSLRDSTSVTSSHSHALPYIRETMNHTLTRLGVSSEENLRRWANEALARFDERDLGLLMTLLKRL
ncbi:tRNA/rRNA methyltransferase [Alcanivorax sp. 1008]|uniref:tRNA/rRNA methyltransferase n=1 Tax=Alcanivorax sp. 1008 TaxID=2816853 RepID=UPI001DBD9238|nr:tRNA/rRNA methyltransferase [Alcanivorax sp. 1008]MCC1495494.1 tRNA/rRNA methyltransferase [Alcanivorax sp. 1008]